MSDEKKLPHRAWAYFAIVGALLIRAWALPVFVLGWLLGVLWDMFTAGWSESTETARLGRWGFRLLDAYDRRDNPPSKKQPPNLSGDGPYVDDYASEDDTDDDDFDDVE